MFRVAVNLITCANEKMQEQWVQAGVLVVAGDMKRSRVIR